MNGAVDRIIAKFGSQAALAAAAGVSQPSVHEWRRRGSIPSRRIAMILAVARDRGIDLAAADFFDEPAADVGAAA